ncbi:hypothetical protein TEA_016484 [Camellia sinensis var. sinensis]|uniref:DC1 domain-containing protein n=1 Tax=Camellia sinensis var. sinensis TaxID=542762 RepID=A0A4S4E6C2_CAMSN|nr:hypothetical protein TEA_016484 [Camellia sinensis var. sinensis]
MELQHFSHEHPLILGEVNDDGEAIVCNVCWENIFGSAFCCKNCLFFMNKFCAEFPEEMNRPIHAHSLTLQHSGLEEVVFFEFLLLLVLLFVEVVVITRTDNNSAPGNVETDKLQSSNNSDDGQRKSQWINVNLTQLTRLEYPSPESSMHFYTKLKYIEMKMPFGNEIKESQKNDE